MSSSNERNIRNQRYDGDELNRNEQVGNEFSDLVLDVPMLDVDELDLEVNELRAHVSLRAELADLVKINVGVDIYLDEVKLGIKGLQAQALLKVKLERVLGIIGEGLEVIDHNPQIVGQSVQTNQAPVGASKDVSQAAWEANRNRGAGADPTEDEADQVTEMTERISDETDRSPADEAEQAGDRQPEETTYATLTGNGDDLQTEEEYIDDQGRIVARARDDSGNMFEEIQDEEGNVLDPNASEEVEDQEAKDEDASEVRATAAAKRKARELGVRIYDVKGTGSGGRILVKDVEKAAR